MLMETSVPNKEKAKKFAGIIELILSRNEHVEGIRICSRVIHGQELRELFKCEFLCELFTVAHSPCFGGEKGM